VGIGTARDGTNGTPYPINIIAVTKTQRVGRSKPCEAVGLRLSDCLVCVTEHSCLPKASGAPLGRPGTLVSPAKQTYFYNASNRRSSAGL
jgi:hypothetical protein